MSPQDGRKRVVIEGVKPEIDAGRFAAKRVLGDVVRVEADIFTDGHDAIAAMLLYKHQKETEWFEVPMQFDVNDRWWGEFPVSDLGRYQYTLQAWVDHFETWRRDLAKRIAAEQDTTVDYLIGAELVEAAVKRAAGADQSMLRDRARLLKSDIPIADKRA
ncbi:MAG TPA: maltotransferase domain-containing protein, partial [Bryobacteraceae bacterium]